MLSRRAGHELGTPLSRWDTLFHPWSTTLSPVWDRDMDVQTFGGFGWMNSLETESGDVLVMVDMPGVKKQDIAISHEHGVLTIRGKRRFAVGKAKAAQNGGGETGEDKDKEKTLGESVSEVSRTIAVPKSYDPDNIKAKLEDGVLTLTIPKKPEEVPAKLRINIE
mmetsp:Transcript_9831/g.26193  ORF Transcript_9831/g.26193 Transcript_9831/m.26193 type:complete len:165 (-) Transcript_9831:608-1102(-)